jgi:hypothetical protein
MNQPQWRDDLFANRPQWRDDLFDAKWAEIDKAVEAARQAKAWLPPPVAPTVPDLASQETFAAGWNAGWEAGRSAGWQEGWQAATEAARKLGYSR